MHKFADAFVQNADSSWFCRAPAEFIAPNGKRVGVTPGVSYRRGKYVEGFDIAQWLDEWTLFHCAPAGIDFP